MTDREPVTDGAGTTGSGDPRATSRGEDSLLATLARRREAGVLVGLFVLFGLMIVSRPDIFFDWGRPERLFFDWVTMSEILARLLRRTAPYVIIGIGMTFLIIGGEFDLSVGSMYAVGGLSFATLLTDYRLTIPVALIVVLALGAAVGVTNGLVVTKVGVPSLIATIGMLSVLRGIAYSLTPGGSRQTPDLGLLSVFGGELTVVGVDVSYQALWAIGLLIVFGFVLQKTRFGYHVYATGDDEDAAEMTGIDTDRVKIMNFALTAALAAFAGAVAISYHESMFGGAGQGFELLIIAAVVIGGTNLFGGEGTLTGMFIGSLVIAIIQVLLVLNQQPVYLQELLTGVVIVLAATIDIFLRR